MNYRDGDYRNVRSVLLFGSHITPGGFRCLIDAFVPLNEEAVFVYQGGVGYSSFLGIDVFPAVEAEEWVSEQGFETIIVSLDKSPWPGFDESIVSAHFVREGIAYRIMVRSSDPARAKEEVKNVVNSLR